MARTSSDSSQNSRIPFTDGPVRPASSNKWKAPLVLIVDLTIAIDCEGLWPVEDFSRKREKPCKHSSATQLKQKPINCGIQLVSKPTCKAERFELNFNRFPQRRKLFQLLKAFVYVELSCNFIRPYHLETVLLYESARFSDEKQWSAEKLSDRF